MRITLFYYKWLVDNLRDDFSFGTLLTINGLSLALTATSATVTLLASLARALRRERVAVSLRTSPCRGAYHSQPPQPSPHRPLSSLLRPGFLAAPSPPWLASPASQADVHTMTFRTAAARYVLWEHLQV